MGLGVLSWMKRIDFGAAFGFRVAGSGLCISLSLYIYLYTHVCRFRCIHTCVHTYTHTNIHAYVLTYIHIHTHIHTHMSAYTLTNLRTYRHNLHTDIFSVGLAFRSFWGFRG